MSWVFCWYGEDVYQITVLVCHLQLLACHIVSTYKLPHAGMNILGKLQSLYHVCWCLGSLCCQDISSNFADYASKASRGGCLSIKITSYQYKNSHYENKTVVWQSYLYNGNLHTIPIFILKQSPGLLVGGYQSSPVWKQNVHGSGHETAAVLLPGFAINW